MSAPGDRIEQRAHSPTYRKKDIMPETVASTPQVTPTRATLHEQYMTASLEGRYQDSVDLYRAFSGLR